jgi:hypothetical protein
MFACLDLKFHKELKLLNYIKALLAKPFQTSYYSLKKLFRRKRISKYHFVSISNPMKATFANEMIPK